MFDAQLNKEIQDAITQTAREMREKIERERQEALEAQRKAAEEKQRLHESKVKFVLTGIPDKIKQASKKGECCFHIPVPVDSLKKDFYGRHLEELADGSVMGDVLKYFQDNKVKGLSVSFRAIVNTEYGAYNEEMRSTDYFLEFVF